VQVVIRGEAEEDIAEAALWYETRSPGLGDTFLEAVKSAQRAIGLHPLLHSIVYRDLRRAPLPKFPYAMFYRIVDHQAVVVACFHGQRDPRAWQARR
jgi:plasmid stabilization system protein ParE